MKTRILMVCLGNICRSPLAEGLLQAKLDPEKFEVDSAGTGHWHVGSAPDSRSIAVAQKNGLDISHQRGMQFKPAFFERYDYIFVMDQYNYEDVLAMASTDAEKAKVQMILDELFPGERVDVPDPYNDSLRGFDRVYEMLDEATTKIAERLS
ncbi:MAG: protein-tyrosine-phosphatase [Leeuwenhoekiella sp.]|nr:MAG: protein-tyrosine-phosphatase [Leeuwenhoekiella sp.]